jgi:hypothetical protein
MGTDLVGEGAAHREVLGTNPYRKVVLPTFVKTPDNRRDRRGIEAAVIGLG